MRLLRERTGQDWAGWFDRLDAWGAVDRTHTEIARWLVDTHGMPGWWAQTVTVGYEQARGLRAPGQRRAAGSKPPAAGPSPCRCRHCSRRSPTGRPAGGGCPASRCGCVPPQRRRRSGRTGRTVRAGSWSG
ncbi:hypothetical protein V2I01_36860 [Micromonospora sp. BRA006-A]|nr:hypothetical protein [Micromonospora sp. BRA006-A]